MTPSMSHAVYVLILSFLLVLKRLLMTNTCIMPTATMTLHSSSDHHNTLLLLLSNV